MATVEKEMRSVPDIFAAISFCLAMFLLVHQQLTTNVWFSWQQFWHHEPLIACGFVAAIALLIGKYVGRL